MGERRQTIVVALAVLAAALAIVCGIGVVLTFLLRTGTGEWVLPLYAFLLL